MAAPDTSFLPPSQRSAERPGMDEHEHPSGWGLPPDGARWPGEVPQALQEAALPDLHPAERLKH